MLPISPLLSFQVCSIFFSPYPFSISIFYLTFINENISFSCHGYNGYNKNLDLKDEWEGDWEGNDGTDMFLVKKMSK